MLDFYLSLAKPKTLKCQEVIKMFFSLSCRCRYTINIVNFKVKLPLLSLKERKYDKSNSY